MEEIKKCMRQAKLILPKNVGVMDTNGLIVAATNEEIDGTTDSSARAVMLSEDMFSSTSGKTYMKIAIGEQIKYIIFIDSDDIFYNHYSIERLYSGIQIHNYDVCTSNFYEVSKNNRKIKRTRFTCKL